MLDTLVARYPDLVIETCAGGGRRVDLGMLRRAQAAWFSDHTVDRHICRAMQLGFARLLPSHLANSAVPVNRNEGDGNVSDRDVLSRMAGALSFDGDYCLLVAAPDPASRRAGRNLQAGALAADPRTAIRSRRRRSGRRDGESGGVRCP